MLRDECNEELMRSTETLYLGNTYNSPSTQNEVICGVVTDAPAKR